MIAQVVAGLLLVVALFTVLADVRRLERTRARARRFAADFEQEQRGRDGPA